MDIMDNVLSGKYGNDNHIAIIDSMGSSVTLPDGVYLRSSKLELQQKRKKNVKEIIEKDVLEEMELVGDDRASRIFRTVWEHTSQLGVSAVISLFRELIQEVG